MARVFPLFKCEKFICDKVGYYSCKREKVFKRNGFQAFFNKTRVFPGFAFLFAALIGPRVLFPLPQKGVCVPEEFRVLKFTAAGNLLLKSEGGHPKPVANPTNAFAGGKPAAVVFETIGRETSPLFLAKPARGVEGSALVGKTISSTRS